MKKNIVIENRKARFDYNVIDTYTAGIVLTGPEVCSIREGKVSLVDCFCYIDKTSLILKNMRVTLPDGTMFVKTKEENKNYQLLLNKKEIKKIQKDIENPGFTVVPLKIFRNERGLFKVLIGVCKGKRAYDKRETIKDRDNKRELNRVMKNY